MCFRVSALPQDGPFLFSRLSIARSFQTVHSKMYLEIRATSRYEGYIDDSVPGSSHRLYILPYLIFTNLYLITRLETIREFIKSVGEEANTTRYHWSKEKEEEKKKKNMTESRRRQQQRRSSSARNASWWIGHPWLIWQADFLVFGDWQGAHGASAPVRPNGPSRPRRTSRWPISAHVSTEVGSFEKLIELTETPWKC